jgi:hypothetical protein
VDLDPTATGIGGELPDGNTNRITQKKRHTKMIMVVLQQIKSHLEKMTWFQIFAMGKGRESR